MIPLPRELKSSGVPGKHPDDGPRGGVPGGGRDGNIRPFATLRTGLGALQTCRVGTAHRDNLGRRNP